MKIITLILFGSGISVLFVSCISSLKIETPVNIVNQENFEGRKIEFSGGNTFKMNFPGKGGCLNIKCNTLILTSTKNNEFVCTFNGNGNKLMIECNKLINNGRAVFKSSDAKADSNNFVQIKYKKFKGKGTIKTDRVSRVKSIQLLMRGR